MTTGNKSSSIRQSVFDIKSGFQVMRHHTSETRKDFMKALFLRAGKIDIDKHFKSLKLNC